MGRYGDGIEETVIWLLLRLGTCTLAVRCVGWIWVNSRTMVAVYVMVLLG